MSLSESLAQSALLNRFTELNTTATVSAGYVADPLSNIIEGVDLALIAPEFEQGAGKELNGKFRAVHSSSALVVNTFGPWKAQPQEISILGISGFTAMKFEKACPTGLSGTAPHLDVILESCDTVVAIESKLIEVLRPQRNEFKESYSRSALPLCEESWWRALEWAKNLGDSPFHAAQLVKHYLGLRKSFSDGRKVVFVYLYWTPLNAAAVSEYAVHDSQLATFSNLVSESEVRFASLNLWSLLKEWDDLPGFAPHCQRLRDRYLVRL